MYGSLFVVEDQLRNECVPYHETDGNTRIWVPGLTFGSLIVRKWWNCILIDYVASQQGRAAIHRPECS